MHWLLRLSNDFIVEASVGHIRDLPRKSSEVPTIHKKKTWADLGVNIENKFKPIYIVPEEKKDQVKRLKNAMKEVEVVYLATDEDREGESISWHLHEVLKPKVPVHRLVFHEITKTAIQKALTNVREIDFDLVQAQETRRIVDRLYGYKVSPLLWTKLKRRNLSAGRVQSVALRMVVDKEKQRMAFVPSDWWGLTGLFLQKQASFSAELTTWKGKAVATGASFDNQGKLKKNTVQVLNKESVEQIIEQCNANQPIVHSTTTKNFTERPSAPFITSTLQQDAIRKFRWTARRTMSVAQSLYENGWITYMRTDSVSLSEQAIQATRKAIVTNFGESFL